MSLSLDLESIILLLVFIAPGFVFTRTYTAYRPRYYREPTAFEQFVLAIVGSTVIHAAMLMALAVGAGTWWLFTGRLIYLMTMPPLAMIPLPLFAGAFVIGFFYLAVTLILARRSATTLGTRTPANRPGWWRLLFGQDPPEPFLLWHTILQIEPLRQDLIPPRLTVQMRSGEFFRGDLYQLRMVGNEENTIELALRNVFYRAATATEDLEPLSDQIVLLKSDDILWLTRNEQ